MKQELVDLIRILRHDLLNRNSSDLTHREILLRGMLLDSKIRCQKDLNDNFENITSADGSICAYKGNSFRHERISQ